MSSSALDILATNTSLQSVNARNISLHVTIPDTVTSEAHTTSLQHECQRALFTQMKYLPWANPYNIVSAEVETISRRIKDNLLLFLFLIGGAGNVINMAVFYKQGLKDRVNLCLFALALADGLHLTTHMVYGSELLYLQFMTDERFGPMRVFMTNHHFLGLLSFGFVSSILSAIIAIERCYCVLHPLTYQNVMRTKTMAAILVTVYVLVISLYFAVLGFRFRVACFYDPRSEAIVHKIMLDKFYIAHQKVFDILLSIFFGVGLPTVVTVVVTVTTIFTAVKLHQIVTWRAETSVSISAREVALTKMLIGNSILFIVCIIPTALTRNAPLVFPEVNTGRHHHNLFQTMVWLSQCFTNVNSSASIVIYYSMGSRYRQTLWALLGRKTKPGQKP